MSPQPKPWRPSQFRALPPLRTTTIDRASGKQVTAWDVRMRVDGRRYFKRLYRSGHAATWYDDLLRGHAAGWDFDAAARRFVRPGAQVIPEPDVLTVFAFTAEHMRDRWDQWAPATRRNAARHLNRLRRHLVQPDQLVAGGKRARGVDAYLDHCSLRGREDHPCELHQQAADDLRADSLPLAEVTYRQVADAIHAYRWTVTATGARRRVQPVSERRFGADVRALFNAAHAKGLVRRNPMCGVELLSPRKDRPRHGSVGEVDRDVVLSISELYRLADEVGDVARTQGRFRAMVLIMGLCGLRPGEAVGLSRRDLELPKQGAGWVTVSRNSRPIADAWRNEDEHERWGPLKGRATTAARRVPIPPELVAELRGHVDRFVGPADDAPLFAGPRGGLVHPSNFAVRVWRPAVLSAFADPVAAIDRSRRPKLLALRRHDLRHTAASLWLAAGVPHKTAQRWGGWEQLSVFLDVYAGVMPNDEDVGVHRLCAAIQHVTA